MTYEFGITYLTCQSCTAKIHCDECADSLKERLLREDDITDAQIDIPNRHLRLIAEGLDESDIEDILEDAGIFAD